MKSIKSVSLIAMLILLVSSLGGCSKSSNIKWPQLPRRGEAICDSLERLYRTDSLGGGVKLLNELDGVAADSEGKARILYWKSLLSSDLDSAYVWNMRARELIDSAQYPYFHARLKMFVPNLDKNNFIRVFDDLKSAMSYFEGSNDTVMQIFSQLAMGTYYLRINDAESYSKCAMRLKNLCNIMRDDEFIAKSTINVALGYLVLGDSALAGSMFKQLLSNKFIQADSNLLGKIYLNIGAAENSTEYLRKALVTSPTFRSNTDMRASIELAIMKIYDQEGKSSKADSMLSGLEPVIARDGDATARQIMHKMKSRKAKSVGDYKTAFEELEKALRLYSYIFSDKDFGNLQHRTFKSELALRESKIRYNDNLARFRLIVVCLFMLLLLLLVIWYSKNRQNHMKLANMQTEAYAAEMALRLEREKKSVTSMTIAVTERERLLSEIRNATDKMHKEGKISAVAKETIEREFKIADMNKAELENLRKAYERVHPDFLKILKEKYPGLTEGDVWLALYISAGLNTKQIAYMMHLQLNSVKKNRQRLRQRMQLAPEESLQDLLRSML